MFKKNMIYIFIFASLFMIANTFVSLSQEQIEKPENQEKSELSKSEDIFDVDLDLDSIIKGIYSQEKFYKPRDARDPFRPFVKVVDKPTELKPEINPLLPPIKRFRLTQFKLVGVLWLEGTPQAMVTDPERNTYILTVGDEIGLYEGKIIEIRDNGIAVEEKRYFEDSLGQRSVKISKSILAFKEDK